MSTETAALTRHVIADSGLSPRQLARLLGVSKNALWLWATGGQPNASRVASLQRVESEMAALNIHGAEDPDGRRALWFVRDSDGTCPFERIRAELAPHSEVIASDAWDLPHDARFTIGGR